MHALRLLRRLPSFFALTAILAIVSGAATASADGPDEPTGEAADAATADSAVAPEDADEDAGEFLDPLDDSLEPLDAPERPALEAGPPAPRAAPAGRRIRRAEGFILRLEGGHTYWRLDGDRIARQLGVRGPEVEPLLINQTQDAPAGILHIGFNFLGHVAAGVDVTATGWNVQSGDRGGAGFAALTVAWHPVELAAEFLPIDFIRERFWDVSLFFGGGYGVLGKDRAMDGLHLTYGARVEVFPARWISLGVTARQYPLRFDRYVIHWDNEIDQDLPERSGGSVFIPTFAVSLRVPPSG